MSNRHEAIAQAASVRLVAAACGGQGELWTRQEQRHAAAATKAQSWAAARPLVAICARCPIVAECRTWAAADQYTGIAAGAAWAQGREKPAEWIHTHPMRKPKLAS